MFFVILAGFLPLCQATLFLTPPDNQWVRAGQQNVTLVCRASEKIRACSWTTPYEKTYPLESGLGAEGGRLTHFAEDKSVECGVRISEIKDIDEGRWRCVIGVVENAEVTTASGMANISIAVPPDDVFMVSPFDQPSVNISAGTEVPVTCTVKNARPAPTFAWLVDGNPVQGKTMDEEVFVDVSGISVFSQTLYLTPLIEYANKTLSCSITHPGLLTSVAVNTTLKITGTEFAAASDVGLPTGAIVGIVIAILILGIIIGLFVILYRNRSKKEHKSAEEVQKIAPDENEAERLENGDVTTTENGDVTTQKPAESFNRRFINLLNRIKKEDKKLDESAAAEFEKVDLNDVDNDDTATEEKRDAEKDANDETVVDNEKVSLGKKVRTFLNKYTKKTKKDDVELADTDVQKDKDKEEPEKDDTEAAKDTVELEPEDKEPQEEVKEEKRIGSETPV